LFQIAIVGCLCLRVPGLVPGIHGFTHSRRGWPGQARP
jgi:hypothetical protein